MLDSSESKWFLLSLFSNSILALLILSKFISTPSNKTQTPQKPPKLPPQSSKFYLERPYPQHVDPPLPLPSQMPFKICLTGGPCAGKTTSLAYLTEKLSEKGFKVLTVPEIPTLTKQGRGMIVREGLTKEGIVKFQVLRIKLQMKFEEYFSQLGEISGERTVVLCDRGTMDAKAYVEEKIWKTILDSQSWNTAILRDRRYDAVIHLVTAANGA